MQPHATRHVATCGIILVYMAPYNKITQGFECMEWCMDDTILYDSNLHEKFARVRQYITKCSRARITFNKEKLCFGQEQL